MQSIAMAFWFAARGQGCVDGVAYTSNARVLFSGLGADEQVRGCDLLFFILYYSLFFSLFPQLGGYSRHKTAFEKGGWDSLYNELDLDIKRLPERNLGRDDRILSDASIHSLLAW